MNARTKGSGVISPYADLFGEPQKAKKQKVRRGGWSWGPVEGVKLRALSMGAGIQSTTLLFMALKGEIGPRPEAVIFADPGDESSETYRHWEWMQGEIARQANGQMQAFTVSRGGKLSDRIRNRAAGRGVLNSDRFVSIPTFMPGADGKPGQGRRQCTREFKIEPLERHHRELMGYKPRQRIPPRSCEVWIGISTDEVVRAGAAFSGWAVNRYPLLEARMSRQDCIAWLERNGLPVPPKSACVYCPYKTNSEWRRLRDTDPEGWAHAVEIDNLVRDTPGMRKREFLHRSCVPLDKVDFSTAEDNGQGMLDVCDGGCGV